MDKAILATIATLVIGVLAEGSGAGWNMTGMGCIVSVAVMGAFILMIRNNQSQFNISV